MKRKNIIIVLIVLLIIRYVYKEKVVFEKYKKEDIKKKMEVYVVFKIKDEDYVSYLVESFEKEKYILNIYKDNYGLESFKKEYRKYEYGDVLKFYGTINKIDVLGNPFEFSYSRYLNSKNICSTISTYKVEKVGKINGRFIMKIGYVIKKFLNKKIDENMLAKEGNLLKSMLYGDTIFLDEKIKEAFDKVGVIHLFAVSGSNVAAIVSTAYLIFKNLKISRNTSNILVLYIVIIFTIISSLELSIVRASLMIMILIFSEMLGKKYNV